jgi:hypothetical protein
LITASISVAFAPATFKAKTSNGVSEDLSEVTVLLRKILQELQRRP